MHFCKALRSVPGAGTWLLPRARRRAPSWTQRRLRCLQIRKEARRPWHRPRLRGLLAAALVSGRQRRGAGRRPGKEPGPGSPGARRPPRSRAAARGRGEPRPGRRGCGLGRVSAAQSPGQGVRGCSTAPRPGARASPGRRVRSCAPGGWVSAGGAGCARSRALKPGSQAPAAGGGGRGVPRGGPRSNFSTENMSLWPAAQTESSGPAALSHGLRPRP